MSEIPQTPLNIGFDTLDITSEERDMLYKNLVIPAKLYNSPSTSSTGVPVYKRVNSEVFVLKVLEHNSDLINQLAQSRNFYKTKPHAYTQTEAMLILTNGVIVKGGLINNVYNNAGSNGPFAFIKCLVDGVETVESVPASRVVIVNTSLTTEELELITPRELKDINAIEQALVDDLSRTRTTISLDPQTQSPKQR